MLRILSASVPISTSAGGLYSPQREQQHLAATARLSQTLNRLMEALEPYSGKRLIDATGHALEVLAKPVGSAQPGGHPWQSFIIEEENGGNGATAVNLKINPSSTLLKSEKWTDLATVTGFDSTHRLTASDKMWITVKVDSSGEFESAEIETGTQWDDWPEAYKFTGDEGDENDKKQTWWQLLAYFRDPKDGEEPNANFGGGGKVLVCPTTTNLLFDRKCAADSSREFIRALVPWHGGDKT